MDKWIFRVPGMVTNYCESITNIQISVSGEILEVWWVERRVEVMRGTSEIK